MSARLAEGSLRMLRPGGKFGTVLVYRLDRLGRALLVVVDAHDRLQASGVGLVSATEHIDTTNLSGRLHFQMLASFAEFERGSIRERTQAGLHRAYRNGKHSGIIPYGYDVGEDGRLRVVEDEADIFREVIENVADGATLYSEATRLNALGVPGPGRKYASGPRRHSGKWTVATLSKLAHRTVYGGTRQIKADAGKQIIEGESPAIVASEVQERAIRRLEENRRYKHRRGDRDYLLASLIECAVCGSKYVGHPSHAHGKPRHYYKCNDDRPEKHRKAPKGHAPYVRADWIEDTVWSDVRRFLENPGEALERARESLDGKEEIDLQERRQELEKRLQAAHAERERWLHLYAQGHISDAELDKHLTDVRGRIEHVGLLLGSVEAEISAASEERQLAESTVAWLARLRERVEEVEADTPEARRVRRELMRLLVASITAERDEEGKLRVEITYRFDPPDERDTGRGEDVVTVADSQGWADPTPRPDAEAFAEGSRELGLSPVVAHAKYLINLASANDELRARSVRALANELVAAGALGVDLVVVHAGSHGGDGEEEGMDRLAGSLDRVRELASDLAGVSGRVAEPVVENPVGAGTQLCSTFDSLADVVRRAGVRVCVDTAHAFVAGYDLSSPEDARLVAQELNHAVGPAVALIHLNDAKNGVGSHRDGHRKIGEGQIHVGSWPELFAGLPGVPLVMETPYERHESDAEEVRRVKELAGGLLVSPDGV